MMNKAGYRESSIRVNFNLGFTAMNLSNGTPHLKHREEQAGDN